jgi:hypothetical protein
MSDQRLNLEVSGSVSAEEVARVLQEFEEKTEGMEDGAVLYKLHDFEMPSLSAVAVKLKDLPRWLRVMRKIGKMAVIADRQWIGKIAELEGLLLPGIEIKGFGLDEGASAEAWLAQ